MKTITALLFLLPAVSVLADGPNLPEPAGRAVFSDSSADIDAGSARRTPEVWTKLVRQWESKYRVTNDELRWLVLDLNELVDPRKAPAVERPQLGEETRARRELTTELARLVLMGPSGDLETRMRLLPFLDVDLASLKGNELAVTRTRLAMLWLQTWEGNGVRPCNWQLAKWYRGMTRLFRGQDG